jgi:hypothetical protein
MTARLQTVVNRFMFRNHKWHNQIGLKTTKPRRPTHGFATAASPSIAQWLKEFKVDGTAGKNWKRLAVGTVAM